jgi:ureidoacrylate peracid hydrolase
MEADLARRVDKTTAALVVVDMQVDYCSQNGRIHELYGADVSGAERILPNITSMMEIAREARIPIFVTKMVHEVGTQPEPFAKRNLLGGRADVCVAGSAGAELWGIDLGTGDRVIEKHRHSAFHSTDLDLRLRSVGRTAILLCGVSSNVCVESTARDACALGYWTTLVEDGCSAYTAVEHESALWNMRNYFGATIETHQVLTAWGFGAS